MNSYLFENITGGSKPHRELPSPQTIFRTKIVDELSQEQMRRMLSKLKPFLWLRDAANVRRIQSAQTPSELLDRIHLASGLGEIAWHDEMKRFGTESLQEMSVYLKASKEIEDESAYIRTVELIISELRWRGDAGAAVLLEAFDELELYGKSLGSIVLGLLKTRAAVEKIWSYYQRVKDLEDPSYLVGGLWGLIDLEDERVSGELLDFLQQQRVFPELFGFLALAGDEHVVIPLMERVVEGSEDERGDAFMALVAVAHRIGRDALVRELEDIRLTDEDYQALGDEILSKPEGQAQNYFSMYYRGFTPGGAEAAMDWLD